jgi:hypothetical protein
MFAKAKYVQRSPEANHGCIMGRRQVQGSPEQSSVWSRYESTPAVLRSDRASFQDLAPIKGNSKPSVDVLTEPGRHELIMGHEGESGRQTLGYRPTPGLISLFTKTGVRRPNPKCPNFSPQCNRRSYADVIRSNMEQGGAPMRTIAAQVLVRVDTNPGHLAGQDKLKRFMVDLTDLIQVMVEDRTPGEAG